MNKIKNKIFIISIISLLVHHGLAANAFITFPNYSNNNYQYNSYPYNYYNPYARNNPMSMIFRFRNALPAFSNRNYYNQGYTNPNYYNRNYGNPNYNNPNYDNSNYNDYNNGYDYGSYNNSAVNQDIAYLLSKMEQRKFNKEYASSSIDDRLAKLETEEFGAAQTGDYITRINRLKQAFSADANGNQNMASNASKGINPFKSFFSAGTPTSIPVSPDYYSSLNNENSDFYSP